MCQRWDVEVCASQKGERRGEIFGRTRGGVLAVGDIPAKWVCSPHWEAKSMKQPLWHLENPFTMIETIQLKPLQSVFLFPGAGASLTYCNALEVNLNINTKKIKMTSLPLCRRSIESFIRVAWDCESDKVFMYLYEIFDVSAQKGLFSSGLMM